MTECVRCALLLLCGLGVALPAQFGRCAGNLCFFQESLDFYGAKTACQNTAGDLVSTHSRSLKDLESVLDNPHDKVWLHNSDQTGAGEVRFCHAASLAKNRDVAEGLLPCDDKLSGLVCQYIANEMCNGLEPTGGALLMYATSTGFILNDTDSFPPGTIAVSQRTDHEYPDFKSLCFSGNWIQAPWICEVLNGGCEHNCDMDSMACVCPEGNSVSSNGISCVLEPRAQPQCPPGGCKCGPGFTQGPGGSGCVDLDECEGEGEKLCPGVHNECVNTPGSYACLCSDGFVWEDGACVNVSICILCEHMECHKHDGVYQCACQKDFMVSPLDPTKCVRNCTERDCPATCDANQGSQCFCQDGYVIDMVNNTYFCTDIDECENPNEMCEQQCENFFGSYRCLCEEGFKLVAKGKCVKGEGEEEEEEEEASGSEFPTQSTVTAAGLQPVALPSYIKTGSILGITVFMLLCVVLLALLTRNMVKRCGKFELSTFKHPDLDIYYLQQVSTETYKRLSLDRQLKNDSQRL